MHFSLCTSTTDIKLKQQNRSFLTHLNVFHIAAAPTPVQTPTGLSFLFWGKAPSRRTRGCNMKAALTNSSRWAQERSRGRWWSWALTAGWVVLLLSCSSTADLSDSVYVTLFAQLLKEQAAQQTSCFALAVSPLP